MNLLTVKNKNDEKFLRAKTKITDPKSIGKAELKALIEEMKKTMRASLGVGLAANQVGINLRLFVAEVPNEKTEQKKFYVIFNPEIVKFQGEQVELEEGCLSVPEVYGKINRYEKVTLQGLDKNGKKVKIKAWGLLAQVFQHETDHLNGILFIDKAHETHDVPETDRLKNREQKIESKRN